METPTMSDSPGQQDKRTFGTAARFGVAVVGVALLVLALTLAWVSGCKSGSGPDSLANCETLQRQSFALGAPLILFAGGVVAFIRTYQVWRSGERWWGWQGVGWFLLVLMLIALTMTAPLALL